MEEKKDRETQEQEEVQKESPASVDAAEEAAVAETEAVADAAEASETTDVAEPEEPAAAETEETVEAQVEEVKAEEPEEDETEALPAQEQLEVEFQLAELHRGDIVDGVVVQVNPENVLVDVGYKSDGVIPLSELDLDSGQAPSDILSPGDELPVYVLSVDGKDGGVLLSQTRAHRERAWRELEQAFDEREIIEGEVVEEVKGGLVVDVGVRGFMPASHVERGYVADLSVYVGKTVRMYVIELDRSKNRVILSHKEVLEEEYEAKREETWATIEEGQVREGVVKGITNFGAFIDLGGVDGLLHVSEMSWGRVNHPSDVVSEGEEIKVKVLNVNREEEKISLGLKQILPNPWDDVADKYPVGSIVDGKVMRLAPFGAFVQLEPGVEGLVHISQLAEHHVHKPEEVVSEGDEIKVKVLRVQPDERRISLSLKEAQRDLRQARAIPRNEPKKEKPQPSSADGVTIGELVGSDLGDLLQQMEEDETEEPDGTKVEQPEDADEADAEESEAKDANPE